MVKSRSFRGNSMSSLLAYCLATRVVLYFKVLQETHIGSQERYEYLIDKRKDTSVVSQAPTSLGMMMSIEPSTVARSNSETIQWVPRNR